PSLRATLESTCPYSLNLTGEARAIKKCFYYNNAPGLTAQEFHFAKNNASRYVSNERHLFTRIV
ncbi:MAG: hypothetical protein IJQ63_03015, partial [Synergistaceae bacterium]|nr:hypothetical protein [Synergistaceae bacterium]